MIEQWNWEREEKEKANRANADGRDQVDEKGYSAHVQNGDQHYGYEDQQQQEYGY